MKDAYIVIHAHHINVYDNEPNYVSASNLAHVEPQHRFASVSELVDWCEESGHRIAGEKNLALGEATR